MLTHFVKIFFQNKKIEKSDIFLQSFKNHINKLFLHFLLIYFVLSFGKYWVMELCRSFKC